MYKSLFSIKTALKILNFRVEGRRKGHEYITNHGLEMTRKEENFQASYAFFTC